VGKQTYRRSVVKPFVHVASHSCHAEMKRDSKSERRVCVYFSFQVVTTQTNQTRLICSRKFKVDENERTSSTRIIVERSVHHDNPIVKYAVYASVLQAAKPENVKLVVFSSSLHFYLRLPFFMSHSQRRYMYVTLRYSSVVE